MDVKVVLQIQVLWVIFIALNQDLPGTDESTQNPSQLKRKQTQNI